MKVIVSNAIRPMKNRGMRDVFLVGNEDLLSCD